MLEGFIRLTIISLALVICAAIALAFEARAADRGLPRARLGDRFNTQVRNSALDLVMTVTPKTMVDPDIDEGEVFSYFAKPSFQLGLRGEPYATQVMDGHLWTGSAEWLLLAGQDLEPVNQRIWTLEREYLPCINYSFLRDEIDYKVKTFQFYLKNSPGESPVNFVRVTATNNSLSIAQARFASASMYGPADHRCQQMKQKNFNPMSRYEMTDRSAVRDGAIIHTSLQTPDGLMSRAGKDYDGPWTGACREQPVGLTYYSRDLNPGESFSVEFAIPHYPADPSVESDLISADFDERLAAFTDYWEGWLARAAVFRVSEAKVNNATRSYIIHALMSQNVISDNEVEQHVNRLHYNHFWLRDSAFFVSFYEKWGYPEIGGALSRHFYDYQRPNGNFLSQRGQLDGWGQSMWAFGNHVRYSGDVEFAKEALPKVERAIDWLRDVSSRDQWGLMPPTDAMDNETILGRYTGHNFWAIIGMDGAIDLCRAAGRDDLADEYKAFRDDYRDRFLDHLQKVADQRNGVIPPGLDVPGGTSWGNLLAVYPGQVMDPFDPMVTDTFDFIRNERMEEGVSMWHQSLHHYVTERIAQTAILRGEQENAVSDFYGMLLHTGSCHEGFEWTIFPWATRDYCMTFPGFQLCNFPPHGWYAINFNNLYRNMLVREDGNAIHLMSAISPEWAKPGDEILVENAPVWTRTEAGTAQGRMSYAMRFEEGGATLELSGPVWNDGGNHGELICHVPYFFELSSASGSGASLELDGDAVIIPPGTSRVRFEWTRKNVEPRGYQLSVEWFKKEYRRRYEIRKMY
jgi:hypothetical protein